MSTTPNAVWQMAVAVEIAAAKWVVATSTGGMNKIRRKTLAQARPEERFDALLEEIIEAKRRFGLPDSARALVAYEAGQEGFWLVRALRARGVAAEVLDPVSLQVDRRARRAKTDRLDAEALAAALWRYLTGEVRALRMLRIPSEAAEDSREWQRERDRLAAVRRGCTDRIGKKLRTQGIWQLGKHWREDLRRGEMRTFAGQPLAANLQTSLVIELTRLEAAEEKLKELNAASGQLDALARQRMEGLVRLRGIGQVGACALSTRLFWRQFDNRRQVGACVGLVGTPYDSGTMRQDQGISKAGDPRLRALLVELAWLWLRYQPDSAISVWFSQRTQGSGKRGKRVMIIAVARRLAIALWRYLKDGLVPEGARFKSDGDRVPSRPA
jgi:transposase